MDVRLVAPADAAAVIQVIHGSFGEEGQPIVAVLDHLRARGDVRAELVAEEAGEVVGYVALSRAWLDARDSVVEVLVLSPLGVAPPWQRQGIGPQLLHEAVLGAESLGAPLVFLEGDPDFYAARGWEQASTYGIEPPSARIPDPACRLVRLSGYEDSMRGRLVYPDAWWRLDLVGLRDPLLAQLEGAGES